MTEVSEMPNLQLLNSRRALFPSAEDESDGDLGHICPISAETDSDSDEKNRPELRNVDDYLIIDTINKQVLNDTSKCTPPNTRRHSNSPINIDFDVSLNDSTDLVIPETPLKESPSDRLKTPHDTSNLNLKAPKLLRKTVFDDATGLDNNKRKLSSPEESPVAKISKLDSGITKSSKVRTALFPDSSEKVISTKTFYSHTTNANRPELKRHSFHFVGIKSKRKSSEAFLCARNKRKNRYGLINAGVGHKIKKIHQRKSFRKPRETKTDLEIINDSHMLDYLEELENLKKPIKQISEIAVTETNVNSNNATSRKRESTTQSEEKRKFFKTTDSRRILNDPNQIRTDDNTNRRSASNVYDFDTSDLSVPEDNPVNLDGILDVLEEDKENVIVLKAHNSINASENSILLHDAPSDKKVDLILSPISQMCDTTSGLVLSSPRGAKNLNGILQSMSSTQNVFNKSSDVDQNEGKLFPVFYMKQPQLPEKKQQSNATRKWKGLSMNQTLIDAGQKNFGATRCGECGLVYNKGEPNDEMDHQNYHEAKNILRFSGWKNERIVTDLYSLGKIIKVMPGDPKMWWKKVAELQRIVNRELGYFDMAVNLENAQAFLYIKNKSIIGCLVSEPGTVAHKLLPDTSGIDMCSEESYPIKCIVQRIWVAPKERKNGVATSLMNSLRRNFMMGYILNLEDIAFSSPTESGKLFAMRYFKTPNFLVYT